MKATLKNVFKPNISFINLLHLIDSDFTEAKVTGFCRNSDRYYPFGDPTLCHLTPPANKDWLSAGILVTLITFVV